MNDIKNRLVYNQLGYTVGDYLILNLSRAIAGDRIHEEIFFWS